MKGARWLTSPGPRHIQQVAKAIKVVKVAQAVQVAQVVKVAKVIEVAIAAFASAMNTALIGFRRIR